ncbi:hypothetical protein L1887_63189 [Cichorium endivia]|nr:hypothetical protein L1887_63189 [Cichorium endivia]
MRSTFCCAEKHSLNRRRRLFALTILISSTGLHFRGTESFTKRTKLENRRITKKQMEKLVNVPVVLCFCHTDLSNCLQALGDATKDGVLAIEERRRRQRDEELASVGVGTCVGHSEDPRTDEAKLGMQLVLKSTTVDRCTTGARTGGIARLDHKVADDTVEDDAVVETLLGQLAEVCARLGRVLPVELEDDPAHGRGPKSRKEAESGGSKPQKDALLPFDASCQVHKSPRVHTGRNRVQSRHARTSTRSIPHSLPTFHHHSHFHPPAHDTTPDSQLALVKEPGVCEPPDPLGPTIPPHSVLRGASVVAGVDDRRHSAGRLWPRERRRVNSGSSIFAQHTVEARARKACSYQCLAHIQLRPSPAPMPPFSMDALPRRTSVPNEATPHLPDNRLGSIRHGAGHALPLVAGQGGRGV